MNTKFTDDFPFDFCRMSNTYTTHLFLAQVFKVDEVTICRAIKRIAPLAERFLKIKPDPILSENDLQLLIVDATEYRIERPKKQRDYYSGKAHACTIKTEVVIDLKAGFYAYLSPTKVAFTTSKSVNPKARFLTFRFWRIRGTKAYKMNIQQR